MDTMKLIYNNCKLLKQINLAVDQVRNDITNTEMLEDRIHKRLSRYVKGDASKAEHSRILIKMVYETIDEVLRKYKKENYVLLSSLSKTGSEGDSKIEYEPVDVLADVESEVIAKEMTALLAQDDHRNKLIVRSWLDGNTNTTSISRLLAQSLGGNAKSHRVYIHRFKQSCQEELTQLLEAI